MMFDIIRRYNISEVVSQLKTKIISAYSFENSLIDSVSGHNGINPNGIQYQASAHNIGLFFTFRKSFVIPATTDHSFNGTPISVSFSFAKPDATPRYVMRSQDTVGLIYSIVQFSNKISVRLYTDNSNYKIFDTESVFFGNGNFYNCVITTDYNTVQIYIDGVQKNIIEIETGNYTGTRNTLSDTLISGFNNTNGVYQLDELYLWKDYILTQPDITYLQSNYYPFN